MGLLNKITNWIYEKEEQPTSDQLIRRARGQWTSVDKIPEQYDNAPLDNGPVFSNGRWARTVGELKEMKHKEYCESLSTQTMD